MKMEGARARWAVIALLIVSLVVGFFWGLPNGDSWAADSISPRSCGLFAIAETYTPGHFHTYPPLQMALLTIVTLPFAAIAVSHAGTNIDALGAELIKPFYMTGIEIGSRLVTMAMAIAIAWNTMRLWTRIESKRAGVAAGMLVAANAVFVYYAHTGNLDVPAIFWVIWCVLEIDRVLAGEPRECAALILATLAVLTKDQVAAALILPLPFAILIVPWITSRTSPLRRNVVRGSLIAIATYALVSGAIINPSGFAKRVRFLLGPASQSWIEYPHGWSGTRDLLIAMGRAVPHFTSIPVAIIAALGLVIAITSRRGVDRIRALMPLFVAVSFTLIFNLAARRAVDRFLLLQSVLVLPYAAIVFERAWSKFERARIVTAIASVISIGLAWLGVASLDATLVTDPRYAAENYLRTLPKGSRVDLFGGPIFVPRVSSQVDAVRPGLEPIADRQEITGVRDVVDDRLDIENRPRAIVLSSEIVGMLTEDGESRFGLMSYRDAKSRAFFRQLASGGLGYERVFRSTCALPFPLECRFVHGSTAGDVWIYAPSKKD
jgi:hypothetical protein